MIPQAYITEWRSQAPWAENAWVEQDLIISRALVEIFRVPKLRERLAFPEIRGTAFETGVRSRRMPKCGLSSKSCLDTESRLIARLSITERE